LHFTKWPRPCFNNPRCDTNHTGIYYTKTPILFQIDPPQMFNVMQKNSILIDESLLERLSYMVDSRKF